MIFNDYLASRAELVDRINQLEASRKYWKQEYLSQKSQSDKWRELYRELEGEKKEGRIKAKS